MNEQQRIQKAQHVTMVGFWINLLLSVGKIFAGIFGRSSAMLADGIHSMSDFVTDTIVIVFIKISGRESDDDHAYGHGKYETFATLLIAVALFAVGIGIFYTGITAIIEASRGRTLPEPTLISFIAAIISIFSKELLFRYTRRVGIDIVSPSVIANAWHHRSDAISSIATAIGVGGAIFLGESWRVLDPIAGIIVAAFIVKVASDLSRPCVGELLERALPDDLCSTIIQIIQNNAKVLNYHKLKTRRIGNAIAIDVHIILNRNLTFVEAHDVTAEIEAKLKEEFGQQQLYVNIHAEPDERGIDE